MKYVLFGILVLLLAASWGYIAWQAMQHARERVRLYSLAFAKSATPVEVGNALAMVNNEPIRPAPMPAAPRDPFEDFEQVGGSFG